ncbi:uncharacterized protein BJ171DRAFT_51026 [Polychytrium aggregatum]|uniref:uncharacterized protein n=1 Tax=Polychytrium aggregatum TaxID=110093 RepID=UPI0022FF2B7D|nr:uncharacterized protein BJ171DRAFT_51026 [Polychytrium aggregatum]KAI9205720.1 hypothetical protein BJ171DRAFT_51026 [Polychytrium aggregatum]
MEPTQLAKPEPVDRLEAFTKVAAVIKGWNPVWRLRLLIGFQIPATIIILALSRVNSIYAGNFNSTWCFVAQIIILLPLVLFSLKKIEYTDVNQKRNLVIERASLTFLGFTIVLGMIATINYMLASNERDLCFRNQQLSGLDCSAYTTPLLGSTLAFGFTQVQSRREPLDATWLYRSSSRSGS